MNSLFKINIIGLILVAVFLSGCTSPDAVVSGLRVSVVVPLGPVSLNFQKDISAEDITTINNLINNAILNKDIRGNESFGLRLQVEYPDDKPKLENTKLVLCWDNTFIEFIQPLDMNAYPVVGQGKNGDLNCSFYSYGELKPNLKVQIVKLVGKTKSIGSLRYAGVIHEVHILTKDNEDLINSGEQIIRIVR